MKDEHLPDERIQMYIDRQVSESEAAHVIHHMQSCHRCFARYKSFLQLDSGLRTLPVEHLASNFSSEVLAKLNITTGTPLLFRVVENLAYVFGLMIVLGMMLTAFMLTGVVSKSQLAESQTTLHSVTEAVSHQVQQFVAFLTSLLQSYLPFVFGHTSVKIAAMATTVVITLALIDRIMRRRVL